MPYGPAGNNPCFCPRMGKQMSCCPPEEANSDGCRMGCKPYVRMFSVPNRTVTIKKCENPCAPKDSLDLALSACYDQHRQWWAPPAATKIQCSTYKLFPWGRCQQRICKLNCLPDECCESYDSCDQDPCCIDTCNSEPYRNHSSHLNCGVPSSHAANSARGYGRGVDGLFYNC